MAHGVENPVEREAKFALAAFPRPLQALEDRLESCRIVVAPHVDDADRNVDLGVNHALLGEALDHAPGGQLVVFGPVSRRVTALKASMKPVKSVNW